MKISRSRSTSRSRWRWRPALTSSRRSRAGVSFGGLGRGGCGGQDGAGVAAGQPTLGQLGERGQRGRVEVFEQVADLVADLLARPHRVLLGAGQHPDGLGQFGVGGQRPVRVGIGAHDVGQQHRVGGIGFGPRHRIAGPVPRGRQRVDRIDHPAGFAQGGHPQAAVGFDPHRDRMRGAVAGLGQQRQQRREPGRVVADPSARHHTPVVVDDGDVVMFCGPIDSAIQAQGVITPSIDGCAVAGGLTRRPNRRTLRSVISLAVRDSSTPQDLVLSKSSRLGNNHREVNPAAGSGNGIPPPPNRICRQARRSFVRRPTSGSNQASPGGRPIRNRPWSPRPVTHPY